GDQARRHRRHLQRGRQYRALADPGDQGLALLPAGPGRRQLPIARRNQAAALAWNVEAQRRAEAEPPRHRGEAIDAGAARGLVEEHVAGLLDRVAQMQRAVAALLPAMKRGVAELEIAGASECGIRGNRAAFER